jgi:prevent-host-death family protein
MKKANMHEAKTHLSKLVQQALNGEEVVIAKNGVPLVKLVPCQPEKKLRPAPGLWKGKIWIADDFDETPQDFIDLLERIEGEDLK